MSITFTFDRSNKTYFAGDKVKCSTILILKEKLLLNSIKIYYQGLTKTSWSSKLKNSKNEEIHECFGAMERYFMDSVTCFQSYHEKIFEPNTFTYNTVYELPKRLPTSFTGRYGQVSYKVKMVISLQNVNVLLEQEEEFYVNSLINLNFYPRLKIPVVKCKCKKAGILWLKSDPITLTTSLPKRGFALGENIPVSIHVSNKSTIEIAFIECRLQEEITFCERRKHANKLENDLIWKKCIGGVQKNETKLYEILIPTEKQELILLDAAKFIKVRHFIVVKAFAKEFNMCLETNMDILLGTVPFITTKT